ncbi:hypothetical protein D3C72_2215840 [compost metagenome]
MEAARAIGDGTHFDVPGNVVEKALENKNCKRQLKRTHDQHDAEEIVEQAHVMQLHEDRDGERERRKGMQQQKPAQHIFTPGEGEARQRIGGRRGDQRDDQRLGSGKQQ